MQTQLLRCAAVFAVVGSIWASPAQANDWNGSYVANGQCFCVGGQDSSVSDKTVQTPAGEKTVSQICNKIGEGPLLAKIVGVFNHPVYKDPQCGNGPFPGDEVPSADCAGSYEPGADCQPRGPKWRLSSMFPGVAKQVIESTPIAAAPAVVESVPEVESAPVVEESYAEAEEVAVVESKRVTNGARYIDPSKFKASADEEEAPASREVETAIVESTIEADAESELVRKARAVAEAEREAERKAQREAERSSKREAEKEAKRQAAAKKERQQKAAAEAARKQASEVAQLEEQDRAAAQNTQAEQLALAKSDAKQAALDKKAAEKQAKLDKKAAKAAAKQAKKDAKAQKAEQARLAKAKAAENDNATGSSEVKEGSILIVTENTKDSSLLAPISALQLPPGIDTKYDDFEYVEALPMSYSFGGFGMAVQGSLSRQGKFQLLGRAGIADSYNEVFVGAGYYFTPANASRLTVVANAGFEYGVFNLTAGQIQTDDTDSGLALSIGSRVAINPMFEVQGTIGYSSFFDGDVYFLGSGFVHITDQLDITSQFEVGDNNSFGLGVRYYY